MDKLHPGTLIGEKYVIIELLGTGGMGHVYSAKHVRIPEFEVAVKVLDPALTDTVENKDKFRNEVVAGYRASHPNIVQMYEYFDLGSLQAFAMELVDGGTLLDLISESRLDVALALSFIKQIAQGLAALHREGTYHRDLKPENILITSNGLIKLTDFGVARIRGGVHLDLEGCLVGTPKYVSPEYVETGESDHRGDIYSLGVLAYELLSGSAPFKSVTRTSLLKERLEPHGLDLREKTPELPLEIINLVERCLSVSVIQRFPHAIDIVDAIRTLQELYNLSDPTPCDERDTATKLIWGEFIKESEAFEISKKQVEAT